MGQILRNAAAKLVGLAHVELRISIASLGGPAPFVDRRLEIPASPRIDAVLHIRQSRCRTQDQRQTE
ncbi:hypothetical protein [Sphingopyxis sp. BSNA05]|uniref:hypothetical protein n=1 Tax=Sphingopyxis sp. BSNA05 TaxID=1236614 RepID=UPI00349F346D